MAGWSFWDFIPRDTAEGHRKAKIACRFCWDGDPLGSSDRMKKRKRCCLQEIPLQKSSVYVRSITLAAGLSDQGPLLPI